MTPSFTHHFLIAVQRRICAGAKADHDLRVADIACVCLQLVAKTPIQYKGGFKARAPTVMLHFSKDFEAGGDSVGKRDPGALEVNRGASGSLVSLFRCPMYSPEVCCKSQESYPFICISCTKSFVNLSLRYLQWGVRAPSPVLSSGAQDTTHEQKDQ